MNQKMTRSIIGIQPRHHRHTPTTGHTPHTKHTCRHQDRTQPTKKHWHTIEFSHNTRTPKHTPQPRRPAQSGLTDPTHTHTTNKIASHANQMKGSTSDCFPTAISPKPVSTGLPGGALSVTLTHIKLHTPNQQHKPSGQADFLRLILGMVRVDQSHEIPGLNHNADRREDSRCHQRKNDCAVEEALSIRCPICDEEHRVAGHHA